MRLATFGARASCYNRTMLALLLVVAALLEVGVAAGIDEDRAAHARGGILVVPHGVRSHHSGDRGVQPGYRVPSWITTPPATMSAPPQSRLGDGR